MARQHSGSQGLPRSHAVRPGQSLQRLRWKQLALRHPIKSRLCRPPGQQASRPLSTRRGPARTHPYYELFPLLCLAVWIMFNNFLRTSEEKLVTDYGVLVPLLGWMSVFTQPRALGRRVAPPVERVVRTLPWGALLLVACQLAAHAAWPTFAPAAITASVRLAHSLGNQRPFVIQLALTSVSCLLTEFLGAHQTVALLLPAAAILAQQRKCSWPYLAVPLTAASSIGVILPTASVTMAVVHDLANLKPDVTVLPGILTKVAAMLVLVLGANTIGSVLLGWTIPIDVAGYGLNASDLFTGADEEHGV
ncbi:uncharacterized protein LOC119444565 [Dermacentor silvarum]|uniref:uncharacterized protein LOC119444565 n=1 Tax=Dermacentor silvarum TaxID=543639 RepID=UPI0021012864|nr:uncharacterized protein LOC119444565 [Dermacentor silvarum]